MHKRYKSFFFSFTTAIYLLTMLQPSNFQYFEKLKKQAGEPPAPRVPRRITTTCASADDAENTNKENKISSRSPRARPNSLLRSSTAEAIESSIQWSSLLRTACTFREQELSGGMRHFNIPRTISPTGSTKVNCVWPLDEIKGQQDNFVNSLAQAGDSPGDATSKKRGAEDRVESIIKRHRQANV
jgi:hypothetical protein